MENNERVYQLALTLIPDIGAITAKKLIAYVGSPEAVFREKASNLRKIQGIGEHLAAQVGKKDFIAEAREELERMNKLNIGARWYLEPDYSWRLKNCEDGPLLLFFRGNPDLNRSKTLSIVGTRESSSYGIEMCRELISKLAASFPELIIVSGLAYGIDISAHRLALDNNLDSIAVLAHGLHTLYPSTHQNTARRMLDQGGLVSDFNSTVKAERNNFLRRNRIIAGLSDATLVVESGKKGGALITAEMASSYNREVLALPGKVTDPVSAGCNKLIKNNIAALVEDAKDIAGLLNWETSKTENKATGILRDPLNDLEKKILTVIAEEPGIGQEILSSRTGLSMHILLAQLLQMELRNWITVLPGNQYKLAVRLE